MNATNYYHILGVSENATLSEIKNAFRRKAKTFHPDINKSEGAHEQFININEAYTFLVDLHSNTTGESAFLKRREDYYNHWIKREREKARAKAAKRAQMNFNSFKNSPVYRTTTLLSCIIDFFLLFLGIFMIIAAVLGLYKQGLYIEDNGEEVLNFTGITTVIVITIAGFFFILLSYKSIQDYLRE